MNSRLTFLLAVLLSGVGCFHGVIAAEGNNHWKNLKNKAFAERKVPANAPVISYKRFAIEYAVRDNIRSGVGIQKVELFITTDLGLTWKKYGEDPDKKSPFVIEVEEDGVYGFSLVSTDNVGNRERPPFMGMIPTKVIIVDTVKPTGKFLEPVRKEGLKGESIRIAWESDDNYPAKNPVTLQYSSDKGNNWRTLKSGLPANGKVAWIPPQQKSPVYMFRIIIADRAGNKSMVSSPGMVITDIDAPTAKVTGPDITRGQSVDIEYEAIDAFGGSGLDRVELWYTADGGKNWERYATDEDMQSPVSFVNDKNLAEVGFKVKAFDKVGNYSGVIEPGAKPDISLIFDVEGPKINIVDIADGRRFIKGGSTIAIEWEAIDPNISENAVEIAWSADGGQSWEYIQRGLPAKSAIEWKVPSYTDKNMNNCLIKISASDTVGNASTALSAQPFTIVANPLETELGVIKAAPEEAEVQTAEEVKQQAEEKTERRSWFSRFRRKSKNNEEDEITTPSKESDSEMEEEKEDIPVIRTPEETMSAPVENIEEAENPEENTSVEKWQHPSAIDQEGAEAPAVAKEKVDEEYTINVRPENIEPMTEKEAAGKEVVTPEKAGSEVEPAVEAAKTAAKSSEEVVKIEKEIEPVKKLPEQTPIAKVEEEAVKKPAKKPLTVEEMLKEAEKDLVEAKEAASREKEAEAIAATAKEDEAKRVEEAAAKARAEAEREKEEERLTRIKEEEAARKAAEEDRRRVAAEEAKKEADRIAAEREEAIRRKTEELERAQAEAAEREKENLARENDNVSKAGSAEEEADNVSRVERSEVRPEDTQAMQLIREAELAIEDKEYLQARLRATEALELDGNLSRGHLILGLVEANEGNLEKATSLVEKAISFNNKDASAFMVMGDLSFTQAKNYQQRYDKGRSSEVRALESDLKPLRENIALHMRNALRSYATAARLKPDAKEPLIKLGEVYYFQAKRAEDDALRVSAYRDAVEQFEASYNKGKQTYKEAFHLGIIHYRLNELDAAVRYFKRGVEVCPADNKPKECYWYLAEIATKQKHLDDALSYWRMTAKSYATDNPRDRKYRKMALARALQIEQQLNNY